MHLTENLAIGFYLIWAAILMKNIIKKLDQRELENHQKQLIDLLSKFFDELEYEKKQKNMIRYPKSIIMAQDNLII